MNVMAMSVQYLVNWLDSGGTTFACVAASMSSGFVAALDTGRESST